MRKELLMRCLVLASVMLIALPVSSQKNKRIANKVAGQVNRISREAGISTRVSSDGSGLDAIDRAYERSLKKERIKELQRSGVTIENANSKRRVASSSSIGGASRSSVRYGSYGSSSSGDYSSSSSSSKSDETNPRYAKEAERDMQQWTEIGAKMQERITKASNWKSSQDVNGIIAQSRGGVVGNKDDGVEPDEGKPKGINVSPLEGVKMDKKEEAKEDDEYARKMQAYYDKFVEDEDSLTDEQLDELEAYLTQLENKKKNSNK